jgi:hypothetical protein
MRLPHLTKLAHEKSKFAQVSRPKTAHKPTQLVELISSTTLEEAQPKPDTEPP